MKGNEKERKEMIEWICETREEWNDLTMIPIFISHFFRTKENENQFQNIFNFIRIHKNGVDLSKETMYFFKYNLFF